MWYLYGRVARGSIFSLPRQTQSRLSTLCRTPITGISCRRDSVIQAEPKVWATSPCIKCRSKRSVDRIDHRDLKLDRHIAAAALDQNGNKQLVLGNSLYGARKALEKACGNLDLVAFLEGKRDLVADLRRFRAAGRMPQAQRACRDDRASREPLP